MTNIDISRKVCRTCGFADCPGARGGNCPRWPAREDIPAEPFQTAYSRHVRHFLAVIAGDEPGMPEKFGPGYVTDLCRCGHERGEHWDGEGTCDPATCGCRTFRPQNTD